MRNHLGIKGNLRNCNLNTYIFENVQKLWKLAVSPFFQVVKMFTPKSSSLIIF